MPEAAALELLDTPNTNNSGGVGVGVGGVGNNTNMMGGGVFPRRIEAFYRFLVHHLDRELNSDTAACDDDDGGGGATKDATHAASANVTASDKGHDEHTTTTVPPPTTTRNPSRLIDSLQGLDFSSVNTFAAGPPTQSITRTLTVELCYDSFLNHYSKHNAGTTSTSSNSTTTSSTAATTTSNTSPTVAFRNVLQASLCREARIRAWCHSTRSYETVMQKKVVTRLPTKILSISAACASSSNHPTNNTHNEDNINNKNSKNEKSGGISFWRQYNERGGHWLPEMIEVEITSGGEVIVNERVDSLENNGEDKEEEDWRSTKDTTTASISSTKEEEEEEEEQQQQTSNEEENGKDNQTTKQKIKYKLIAVVSFIPPPPSFVKKNHHSNPSNAAPLSPRSRKINDKAMLQSETTASASASTSSKTTKKQEGHHVVHMRIPKHYQTTMLTTQANEAEKCALEAENFNNCWKTNMHPQDKRQETQQDEKEEEEAFKHDRLPPLTLSSQIAPENLRKQVRVARTKLRQLEEEEKENNQHHQDGDNWVLFNGFVVSKTIVDDARAFHVPFKEPCQILYRAIEKEEEDKHDVEKKDEYAQNNNSDGKETMFFDEQKEEEKEQAPQQPNWNEMNLSQVSPLSPNGGDRISCINIPDIPQKGDLVAIDAEFVSVQHEESILTSTGSKVTLTEGRHALARVSVVHCRSDTVLIDDYVLPQEPVVDYLTRFSGINPGDLDPSSSSSHNNSHRALVTMRTAYLKLRVLVDRGCIFVGHGLDKDFRMLNMFVPPSQIIDTVMIFRQEKSRMISLRFLANYLLGRDMQQDTHDSIEDAKMAYQIYLEATRLKREGLFHQVLRDIYDFGRKTEWKLGVGDA